MKFMLRDNGPVNDFLMARAKFDIKSFPGFFPITILCLVILYAPRLIVTIYSLNDSNSITNWEGVSFSWYVDVFTGPESAKFKIAAWNSFTIAIVAATIATSIATLAATPWCAEEGLNCGALQLA